jgi:hypothetical protein
MSEGELSSTAAQSISTIFRSDIEEMMYGFGDSWPVEPESAKLIETLVVQYIEDIVVQAAEVAQVRGQLDKECFMFLARTDRQKFTRICKLLEANEDLKKAKKRILHEELLSNSSTGNK